MYPSKLLDGEKFSASIRESLKSEITQLREQHQLAAPKLAYVVVGHRSDSEIYIKHKKTACEKIGIDIQGYELEVGSSQESVIEAIETCNNEASVSGIIVQLPMPEDIDEVKVLETVSPEKDVDGLHPINMGKLAMKNRQPLFEPCTALACLEILYDYNVPLVGSKSVVIGRSNLVGLPACYLLHKEDSTVTLCHSKTQNLEDEVKQADIVVAAVGVPKMIKGSWIKPGAVVIDVGINVADDSEGKARQLCGDVDFEEAVTNASLITPVPGGVGPMTVAMLMKNTVKAWKRQNKL